MTATGLATFRADPMVPRSFVVTRNHQDTHDTFTLDLRPVAGEPPAFQAGQFTMLNVFGVGEVPISISGDPTRPDPLRHTIRDVGPVTHALGAATPGTVIGVRGPFGTGWDLSSVPGGDLVFVAGGIGLAPLRPAILEACARRADFGRVALLYGTRSPRDILFGEELLGVARDFGVRVEVIVDNGQHDWRGRVGLVTNLIPMAGFDPAGATAFVCGPEVMMRYAATAFVERGLPASRLRLSMERNMKCGVGLCGHCQLRELLVCVDGPVLTFERLAPLLRRAEL